MRQQLPESAGYPLLVNDIGETVYPGQVFNAPRLVPGCVPAEDGDSPAGSGAGEDQDDGGEGAGTPPGAQGKPRVKGQRL